jgi:hypothetical protein
MATQLSEPTTAPKTVKQLVISWEALPDDFQLEDEPVENTGQPLLAGALRESLEIAGFIKPEMLIVSNFGLCATVNGEIVVKAPDWLYIPSVKEVLPERRSYTSYLEGEFPLIVMEFLSHNDGGEYSVKRSFPPGKWFFYEQVLQVPIYVIFEPNGGLLEFYELKNDRYQLQLPDENGRHWIENMGLFLGTWQGEKEGRNGYWLRWWDKDGNLLPWGLEQIAKEKEVAEQERQRAERERERAEQERQRAEQEKQEKERLIAFLVSQGIDPNNLPT